MFCGGFWSVTCVCIAPMHLRDTGDMHLAPAKPSDSAQKQGQRWNLQHHRSTIPSEIHRKWLKSPTLIRNPSQTRALMPAKRKQTSGVGSESRISTCPKKEGGRGAPAKSWIRAPFWAQGCWPASVSFLRPIYVGTMGQRFRAGLGWRFWRPRVCRRGIILPL